MKIHSSSSSYSYFHSSRCGVGGVFWRRRLAERREEEGEARLYKAVEGRRLGEGAEEGARLGLDAPAAG
eukprot:CAMPEP_0118862186 /NCGR_PEP_ID=MMETSP1163-20130328/7476_1 /TAXON_ID=124430 /ORGANISM="Phaeomonas parva, Strain CCMP2877" /LENGTH=68 /DNA_ID=CAMNT_0006796065 /DNA_START=183 /DNA_END=386 /DNA_ORIENTATION=+